MFCIGEMYQMNNSLYLVQSSVAATPTILLKLQQVYTAQDHIVFMGDSVALLNERNIADFSHCYCLENEKILLNDHLVDQLEIIDYSQFADLILKFERCVTFK